MQCEHLVWICSFSFMSSRQHRIQVYLSEVTSCKCERQLSISFSITLSFWLRSKTHILGPSPPFTVWNAKPLLPWLWVSCLSKVTTQDRSGHGMQCMFRLFVPKPVPFPSPRQVSEWKSDLNKIQIVIQGKNLSFLFVCDSKLSQDLKTNLL